MKLSPQLRINLGTLGVITAAYTIINVFIAWFNISLLNTPFSLGPSKILDPGFYLLLNLITGLVAGLVGGTSLIWVNNRIFRRKSYRFSLFATGGTYAALFILLAVIVIFLNVRREFGDHAFSREGLHQVFIQLNNPLTINLFVLWGVITLLTLFLLQVQDKFGPGILPKFIIGRYHKPKKVQRICMFLDMRSSTTIAEQLPNEQFFNLLKDLFADITGTILRFGGEIYQYVGDEIIITWPVQKSGKEVRFLNCYLGIQKELEAIKSNYMEKYGVHPELKAGIHCGEIMAGEVGVIKKDIMYTGDVLNTASRIQGECNRYGVNLLLSDEAFKLIPDPEKYQLVPIGSIELRGKKGKTKLYTIRAASD